VPWLGSTTTGKWRALVQVGHGSQRQRESRVRLESADAALAEDHVRVAGVEDVFGGQQELIHRGRRAFQEHRRAARRRFQQAIVLHIAAPICSTSA